MVLNGNRNPRKWAEATHIWTKENFALPPFLILSQSAPIFHELGNRSLGNCLYVRNNQDGRRRRGKKENKSKKKAVRTDGHVKKGKPSTFLGEYYRVLFSVLCLSWKPFNSGILLLPSFSSFYLFFFPFFSMNWEVYKSPLSCWVIIYSVTQKNRNFWKTQQKLKKSKKNNLLTEIEPLQLAF